MKKKSVVFMSAMTIAGAFLNGCGSSSSGGSGISSVANLPKASGPVTTSSSLAKVPETVTTSLTPWNQLEAQLAQRAGIKVTEWGNQAGGGLILIGPQAKVAQCVKRGNRLPTFIEELATPMKFFATLEPWRPHRSLLAIIMTATGNIMK